MPLKLYCNADKIVFQMIHPLLLHEETNFEIVILIYFYFLGKLNQIEFFMCRISDYDSIECVLYEAVVGMTVSSMGRCTAFIQSFILPL